MLRLCLIEPALLERLLGLPQHPQDERVLRPLAEVSPGVVRERLDDFPEDGRLEERGDVPLRFEVRREDALLELDGAGLSVQRGVADERCVSRVCRRLLSRAAVKLPRCTGPCLLLSLDHVEDLLLLHLLDDVIVLGPVAEFLETRLLQKIGETT